MLRNDLVDSRMVVLISMLVWFGSLLGIYYVIYVSVWGSDLILLGKVF